MASANLTPQDPLVHGVLDRRTGFCPHAECGHGVGMTLRVAFTISPRPAFLDTVTAGSVRQEIWTCDLCGRGIVEFVGYDEDSKPAHGHWIDPGPAWRRVAWPGLPPRQLEEDVPELVRELYTEASKAENAGAMRLAGVGYRAAVEEICKQRGATQGTLQAKIKALESSGVSATVISAMDETRVVGNASVHDAVEFSPEEIDDIAKLIEEVCLVLYVQPAQRQRMAVARQQRIAAAKASKPGA